MAEIGDLIMLVREFRDARDWKQFHNPKDSAISLTLEAAEVLEHFQWKNKEEMEAYVKSNKVEIGEELADVLYWVFLMSNDLGIDLSKAFIDKLQKSGEKYPIDKSKGNHKKYTEL
jgi:dCTP diphosphatase